MIRSFACSDSEELWGKGKNRRFAQIVKVAVRKLQQISAARKLEDLRIPPGNRLEPLQGNRWGQHSIRINDKWRVCFVWKDGDAEEVEITDYH